MHSFSVLMGRKGIPRVHHKGAFSKVQNHGPGHRAANRFKAHWHFSTLVGHHGPQKARSHTTMDTGEPEAKKAKNHEAHMIPGLGPRMWGFPNTIITKLTYCDFVTLTSTLGSVAYQVCRANSVFDPDYTGTGHQPMWRDNFASIYDQYTVIGSKITTHFNHTTATGSCIVGIHTDDDQNNTSTLTTVMEQNNSAWQQLGNTGSGHDHTVMTATFEPLMAFGVDAKDDGSSATAIGSNPTEEFMFQMFAANQVGGTSTINIAYRIEYTVKFSELISQAQN